MASFKDQEITTATARKFAKNYREQKLGKRLKANDTQGVWFSIEILLESLGVPEVEINDLILRCKDPHSGKPISGLRFYFGAYEENYPSIPKKPHDKGRLNLVIVQTERLEVKETEREKIIVKHRDILEDESATPAYPKGAATKKPVKEYNDGQICPPYHEDEAILLEFE